MTKEKKKKNEKINSGGESERDRSNSDTILVPFG